MPASPPAPPATRPAARDVKGWDLFDNQGFGQSQFDQSVTYQRAIEGELTRTIQAMTGVSTARIAIVLAQTGALSSQDTPASASVVLAMTGGQTPSNGLVQAIVNTVARSVQGLSTDNVVVTDDQGHVLAGAANSADTAAAQAKDAVEQQLHTKIDSLLATALGKGHASIAVSADVDSSKVEQEITTYAPVGQQPAGEHPQHRRDIRRERLGRRLRRPRHQLQRSRALLLPGRLSGRRHDRRSRRDSGSVLLRLGKPGGVRHSGARGFRRRRRHGLGATSTKRRPSTTASPRPSSTSSPRPAWSRRSPWPCWSTRPRWASST